jgi:hypothetical protein
MGTHETEVWFPTQETTLFYGAGDPRNAPLQVCITQGVNGICEAEAESQALITMDGQNYVWGNYIYTGQRCSEDPTDAPNNFGSKTGPGLVGASPTGTSSSGGGLSSADSANLAATKDATQGTSSQLGTANTRLNQLIAGQCGGPGQPRCAVDEGNTDTSNTTTQDNLASSTSTTGSQMDSRSGALSTSTAPTFLPGSGRWQVSLSSLLPSGSCTLDLGDVHLAGIGTLHQTFSVCEWGGYVNDFFYWLFGAVTLFGIWMILFRS